MNTYHYWDDDDGDGQGGQVTATGHLEALFFDKYLNSINPSDALTLCRAPYYLDYNSVEDITLTTQYGVPNSLNVDWNEAYYYFNPAPSATLCHTKPTATYSSSWWPHWDNYTDGFRGYLIQSTNPASYGLNFPTTGMDGYAFDLDIRGVDASQLTWQPVTHSGITATVSWTKTSSRDKYPSGKRPEYVTRVTLTGPKPSYSQIQSNNPSPLSKPTLPQTFELVGRDSAGNALITYGFELKQWFVRGTAYNVRFTLSEATTWL